MIEALYAAVFIFVGGVIWATEFLRAGHRKAGISIGLFMSAVGSSAVVDSVYAIPVLVVYMIVVVTTVITFVSIYWFFSRMKGRSKES